MVTEHLEVAHDVSHWFELVWDNLGQSYRAWCRCGLQFGHHDSVMSAGEDYDRHIDEVLPRG